MNRTYSRGGDTYRVIGRWPDYTVAVWCDCIFGPHWHHLGDRVRLRSAELLISEHAFESCREGDGLATASPKTDSHLGASSSRQTPVDRTQDLSGEVNRPVLGVRSTFPRRIP